MPPIPGLVDSQYRPSQAFLQETFEEFVSTPTDRITQMKALGNHERLVASRFLFSIIRLFDLQPQRRSNHLSSSPTLTHNYQCHLRAQILPLIGP